MKNKSTYYRHGDLGITPIKKDGEWQECNEITLALGEATGHHHTLYPNPGAIVERMKGFNDVLYFRVKNGTAQLRHQEHNTLEIGPGTYEIHREQEYDYFENEMKKVVD